MGDYMSYENIPKNIDESAVLVETTNIPIEISSRGNKGVAVFLRDQITDTLDLYFLENKTVNLTLAADAIIDTKTIQLTSGHGLTAANSVGHILELSSTVDGKFYQGKIVNIVGDTITLGSLLNRTYLASSSVVSTGNPNLAKDAATGVAIDGTSTPVIFRVKPTPTQSGDITRLLLACTSNNESDVTTFGGAPALTSGLLFRLKKTDGTYRNLFTYRDNFDVILHGFNYSSYIPKAGNTLRGFVGMITFAGQANHGVAIRLDGSLGEELQIVITEAMNASASGNQTVSFIAQGSELQS